MAYQQPAFMFNHLGSGLAVAAITARNAGTLTDASKRAWIDQRATPLGSCTATGSNGGFTFDLGTTSAGDVINRCVIPAGHALATRAVQVLHDSVANMGGSPLIAGFATMAAGVTDIDCTFNPTTGLRYWGFQYNLSTNGFVISMGEFWLGTRTTLGADAYVQPGFANEYEQEIAEDRFGGRTATVALSPARRRFRLEVLNLDPSGADYALLEQALTTGRERPFWYWPPDTLTPGPYLVQLSEAGSRRNENRAPQAGIRYGVTLEMVEQLT